MNASKSSVRYLGYQSRPDGGRGFDFSFERGSEKPTLITIEASPGLFQGPERMALQEASGICYETLKCRILADAMSMPDRFNLTSADVARHRKSTRPHGKRH
jgi:hypothetical protein